MRIKTGCSPINTCASSYEINSKNSGQHEKHWRLSSHLAAPVTALAGPVCASSTWRDRKTRTDATGGKCLSIVPTAKAKEVKARRYAQSSEGQAKPGIEPGPTWQVLRG